MSKNKHGDLFNTSLTEIIIILFFVLMLFALYNIDKVNKENIELGSEVDILSNDVDILIDRNKSMKQIIKADNKPSSLGPINVELTQRIVDLKKEKKELEREIQRLNPVIAIEDDGPEELIQESEESEIAGNCIDKVFWRQCAEKAWPLQSTPPYEYLFDIGMCSAGDIVVIESSWRMKGAIHFDMVDGASNITDQKYIKRNEIENFISLIHDKSLDFLPEQTQHAARLINLELVDTDTSIIPRKTIEDHMKFDPFRRGTKKFNEIRARFPKNPCSFFIAAVKENNKPISKQAKQESSAPASSPALFKWDGVLECDKASGRTNPKFTLDLELEITAKKRVKVKSYSYEKTNKNNRLIALDVKRTMQGQRKNIKPAMRNGQAIDSLIKKQYNIGANVCR